METGIKKPFFSVIMACHNAASFIQEAILSVLNQTIDDWELVIVDDSSTDESYEIALRFSLVNDRIKVLRLDCNRGAGYARNLAVENSRGKWLAILDADDKYFSDKLELQRDFINSCNQVDIVLVGTGVVNIFSGSEFGSKYAYPLSSARLKSNLHQMGKFPPHSSLVYRASAFREVGGFNTRFLRSQDYDLWLRLSDKGDFGCLEMPLVQYRVHGYAISVNACAKGFTQYMYGVAALVSFRVMRCGFHPPSHNDDCFESLMTFVRVKYVGSKYEKAHGLLQNIKKLFFSRDWLQLVLIIMKNLFLFLHIIAERVRLVSFSDIVFQEYIHAIRKDSSYTN
jgi:glycosyltransferase involved in cell wall biosynthesis